MKSLLFIHPKKKSLIWIMKMRRKKNTSPSTKSKNKNRASVCDEIHGNQNKIMKSTYPFSIRRFLLLFASINVWCLWFSSKMCSSIAKSRTCVCVSIPGYIYFYQWMKIYISIIFSNADSSYFTIFIYFFVFISFELTFRLLLVFLFFAASIKM